MHLTPEEEIDFIARKLSQELSEEEERQFGCWLAEAQEHRMLFEEIESIYLRAKKSKVRFEPDTEVALQKVKKRRRSIFSTRQAFGRYAALILVALGIGIYGVCRLMDGNGTEMVEQCGERSKAILHLASGEKIVLEGKSEGTCLRRTEESDIWLDSSRVLKYYTKKEAIARGGENTLEVPVGGEYGLTLSDGTRIWLNAATRLTYPEVFQGSERVVELTGEAFFEVKADTALPFIVKTGGVRVKVLGTTFNVKAYPDELNLYTTLVTGKVEVFADHLGQRVVLEPGEQAVADSLKILKKQVNLQPYISWREGKFVFINAPLDEICKQIARWYDVEIRFADEEIRKICFTGAILKFRPLDDLLKMIEVTSRVQFKQQGKTLLLMQKK